MCVCKVKWPAHVKSIGALASGATQAYTCSCMYYQPFLNATLKELGEEMVCMVYGAVTLIDEDNSSLSQSQ